MNPRTLLVAPLLLLGAASPPPNDGGLVAIQAGTIHPVGGDPIEGGGTVLVRDGRIVAIGADVAVPAGARVVDYGPAAVIVPGLVAADSSYVPSEPSERTADPGLLAIDAFDPYSSLWNALTGGVTTVYLSPARGRLIAGQGAVVKTGGVRERRVLARSAALQGSIAGDARETPSYWEPPVPATVDVGIGEPLEQLPRTTMGGLVALRELLALARGEGDGDELRRQYGDAVGPQLAALLDEGLPWRLRAETAREIRALLDLSRDADVPLVIDGAFEAGDVAEDIAAADVPVLFAPHLLGGEDFGKDQDAPWPRYDAALRLARAGARFAISLPVGVDPRELRFTAGLAMRGGLAPADALRAITLTPAEILGVADRVGSLEPGKDADLVVLSGPPMEGGSMVVATWVDGEVVWKVRERSSVVIEVGELHVGDGEVLAPGQLLIEDGRIVEVARRVGHPPGATIVRGFAAMPGMIDALGHLGLEGSKKPISPKFELARIVEPGDYADRRVAQAGVTTVVLGSRSDPGSSGSPTMAYKPAGEDLDRMVVADPNALRLQWSETNRHESGEAVRKALEKALEYKAEWEKYEKEIADWKPSADDDEGKKEEASDEDAKNGDDKDDEKADDDDKAGKNDKGKKDRKGKKKDDDEEDLPHPVTGVWEGELQAGADDAPVPLRLQLLDREGVLEGNLRCDRVSSDLVPLSGSREEKNVTLHGFGDNGRFELQLELAGTRLEGSLHANGVELTLGVDRRSEDYQVARRSERRAPEKEKPPKGKPKEPSREPELEPLVRAMAGEAAVIVSVERADEILDCVAAFEQAGIRPILEGAEDAHEVADEIVGRVAGVLLSHEIVRRSEEEGTRESNRYAELARAGIPVAFHSGAEEGAVELPLRASFAVSRGMSPLAALRALTGDAAEMMAIDERVGFLRPGLDADVLLLDGPPLEPSTSVLRVWVDGEEVRP